MSYLDVILTVKIRDGHKCRPALQVSGDASFYIIDNGALRADFLLILIYEL